MVDPCFVTSDDSDQEGVIFFIIEIQILLADVQACLCSIVSCFEIHLAQTFRKPSVLWMIS